VVSSATGLGAHVRQGGHITFTLAGSNLDTLTSGALGAYPVASTNLSATA
jgi:hypothetical protein